MQEIDEHFPDWNYGHPKILYGLIRALKPQSVLEVGSYRGYASCYMARALKENGGGRLHCIDDFSLNESEQKFSDPEAHFWENLTHFGLQEYVTLTVGDSRVVHWPEPIDFAYIDGWHSHIHCKHDFMKATIKGAQCICLDDTVTCRGPRNVANEVRDEGWNVLTIPSDNGLTICLRNFPLPPPTFTQEDKL